MGKKIIIGTLIIIGIFLRLWQINALPAGLFVDEINIAVDAKSLAQNGTDQFGKRFPFYFEDVTDFKLPGYIYAVAGAYTIFGNQIITVRVPSLLAGIVSIFLLGYLTKLLFPDKKYLSWYAMGILALSPYAIHFSRIGYETNFALSFLLLYLISFVQVVRGKKTVLWLFVGSIACIIANWTYPSPRFITPIFTLLLLGIFSFFHFPHLSKQSVKKTMIFLIPLAISFIPTIIFPFADIRLLDFTHIQSNGNIFGALLGKGLPTVSSWIRLWNIEFLFDKSDQFAYRAGTKEIGVFFSVFIIPFFIGICWYIKNFSKKDFTLVFLGLFTLIAGLPSALSYDVPYTTRALPMLIPYCIVLALGIYLVIDWLKKQKVFLRLGISLMFFAILLYQIGLFSYIYFTHFRQTSLPEFPLAPVQVASYIVSFRKANPTTPIYFLSDRECARWSSDALHLWYFANLSNKEMIAWNIAYRKERYAEDPTSPFSAYEENGIIQGYIPSFNLYLYPTPKTASEAPIGSLLVHCGIELQTYSKHTETLQKIFYMYPEITRDPYYFVTIHR